MAKGCPHPSLPPLGRPHPPRGLPPLPYPRPPSLPHSPQPPNPSPGYELTFPGRTPLPAHPLRALTPPFPASHRTPGTSPLATTHALFSLCPLTSFLHCPHSGGPPLPAPSVRRHGPHTRPPRLRAPHPRGPGPLAAAASLPPRVPRPAGLVGSPRAQPGPGAPHSRL